MNYELMKLMNVKWTEKEIRSQLEKILTRLRRAYQLRNSYLLLTRARRAWKLAIGKFVVLGSQRSLTKAFWAFCTSAMTSPQTLLDSPVFMSLIHESAGVPRIVEKTVVEFQCDTSHDLQYHRKQIVQNLSVGQLADENKRKQAIILSMSLLRHDAVAAQLVDEGYMYPLYSTTEFGVPPLFVMLWAARQSMPLLQAARGFVEHAKFLAPALQSRQAFEWQVASLFLLRLWAVFHEKSDPTVWDMFRISPPPGGSSFRLVQPKKFLAPQRFADICDPQDFLPAYGGPAIPPEHSNAGYDIIFPIECQDVGMIHVATEVTPSSKNRTPQEIAAQFEKSFYVYDQAKQRRGIKMPFFHRFSEGKIVFFYVGVPEKKATLDKCTEAWQKIKKESEGGQVWRWSPKRRRSRSRRTSSGAFEFQPLRDSCPTFPAICVYPS